MATGRSDTFELTKSASESDEDMRPLSHSTGDISRYTTKHTRKFLGSLSAQLPRKHGTSTTLFPYTIPGLLQCLCLASTLPEKEGMEWMESFVTRFTLLYKTVHYKSRDKELRANAADLFKDVDISQEQINQLKGILENTNLLRRLSKEGIHLQANLEVTDRTGRQDFLQLIKDLEKGLASKPSPRL